MSDKYELNSDELSSVSGGTNPPDGLHIYTVAELDALKIDTLIAVYSMSYEIIALSYFKGKNAAGYYYANTDFVSYTTQNYYFAKEIFSSSTGH